MMDEDYRITKEDQEKMARRYRREYSLNSAINIAVHGTESHGDAVKILANAEKFFEYLDK